MAQDQSKLFSPRESDEVAEKKQRSQTVMIVCASIFASVLQHVIQLQAEPLLIRQLVNNDPVTTAAVMANTSGIIGILGLFVNQLGFGASSFSAVVACRVVRTLFTTFSSSVMCSAALSDVVSGKELSIASSTLGAAIGLAVVTAPILEGFILQASSMDITRPAVALSALGALHTAFLYAYMPETNAKVVAAAGAGGAGVPVWEAFAQIDLSSLNPLSFLALFREDPALTKAKRERPDSPEVAAAVRNRGLIGRLVIIATLQCFLEGKNVTDIVQVWQREHLHWDAFGMRDFTVAYGVLCYLAGQFLTPALLRNFSPRFFTSLTNCTNMLGFFIRGSVESPYVFWSAVPFMLPGVNGASASAVKSMATDRAIAAGIGRGELSAWLNNLRALVVATAPVIYGNFYGYCVNNGIHPGHAFTVAAFFGAVMPECVHRSMSDADTQILQGEEKAKVQAGMELASGGARKSV